MSKTLFPLGEIPKTEVRKIAEKLALPNAAKKDSTGICFIGERPFRDFLNRYLSYKPGPMKTDDGTVVGEHVGLSFYTLGQRKGIGIGGMKKYKNADGTSDAVVRRAQGHRDQHAVHRAGARPSVAAVGVAAKPPRPAGSRASRRGARAVGQDALPPGRRGVRT